MKFLRYSLKLGVLLIPIATSVVVTNDNFFVKPKLQKNIISLEDEVTNHKNKEVLFADKIIDIQEDNNTLKDSVLRYKDSVDKHKEVVNIFKEKLDSAITKHNQIVSILKNKKENPIVIDSLIIAERYMQKFGHGKIIVKPYIEK